MSMSINIINVIFTNYYTNYLNSIRPRNKELLQKVQLVRHRPTHYIITHSMANTFKIWDIGSWILKKVHNTQTVIIDMIMVDKRTCLITTNGGGITLLNIDSYNVTKLISTKWSYISNLICFGNSSIAFSNDSDVVVYDYQDESVIKEFYFHNSIVNCIAKIEDVTLASGDNEGNIIIWHIDDDLDPKVLSGHKKPISSLLYLDNQILASGSRDGEIFIWDILESSVIKLFEHHPLGVSCLIRYNDNTFISAGNHEIGLWSISGLDSLSEIKTKSKIRSIILLGDNRILMSSIGNRDLNIINIESKVIEKTITLWFDYIRVIKYMNDEVIIDFRHKQLTRFSLNTSIKEQNLGGNIRIGEVIQFKANLFIFSDLFYNLYLYDMKENKIIKKKLSNRGDRDKRIDHLLKFDKDQVIGANCSFIRVWNLKTDFNMELEVAELSCIINFDSNYLISGGRFGDVFIWDIKKPAVTNKIKAAASEIKIICKIDNERFMTAAYRDNTIRVWNVLNRQTIASFDEIAFNGMDAFIKINGGRFVFNNNIAIKVFNMETGKVENELLGHDENIIYLKWIDDDHILSCSQSMTIKIWNLKNYKCVETYERIGERMSNSSLYLDNILTVKY
jgi:WD40 repeat protein